MDAGLDDVYCNDADGVDYDLQRARIDTALAAEAVRKAGFRDAFGSLNPAEAELQAEFDKGYRGAVSSAYRLGVLRGVARALSHVAQAPRQLAVVDADGAVRASTTKTLRQYKSEVSFFSSSLDSLAQQGARASGDASGDADRDDEALSTALSQSIDELLRILADAERHDLVTSDCVSAVRARLENL
jgi:hypothetical protein